MWIPLGTDRPLRRATVATWVLLVLNVAAFGAQVAGGWLTPEGQWAISERFALRGEGFRWWTLVTYAFVHGDWWHLAGNMLFLWVFGPNIEDRFGRVWFVVFYLLGAVVAGGLHVLVESTGVVGASGAIAACTGAYLIMFPHTQVRAISLLFVIGLIRVPAWWFIGLAIVWDILARSSGRGTGVAHLAHLGGYGFGAMVGFVLLWLKVLPREPYDVFSMSRQMYRRRQIRSAAAGSERAMARHWEQARAKGGAGGAAEASARAKAEAEREEAEVSEARVEVARLLAGGDLPAAGAAYKRLVERFGAQPMLTTLSRRHQYELANHFYLSGDQMAAVYAYERFLAAYPKDPESPQIRLLLGRINARYLNDPIRAKALLKEAIAGLRDEETKRMAERELEALG